MIYLVVGDDVYYDSYMVVLATKFVCINYNDYDLYRFGSIMTIMIMIFTVWIYNDYNGYDLYRLDLYNGL